MARPVGAQLQIDGQICQRQQTAGFVRPLGQFQTLAGENITKAGFLPFFGIVEAIEIKMPDGEVFQLVGLDYGIAGALDASAHTKRLEQMTRKSGFTDPQITAQFDKGLPQGGLRGQLDSESLGVPLIQKGQAFYNRQVSFNSTQFVTLIRGWARELGFSQIGVTGVDLSEAEAGLQAWLRQGFHGNMGYMAEHGLKRARPAELVPGTISVVTASMNYLPLASANDWQARELSRLGQADQAVVSMYARGRDYHKVLRSRLRKLAEQMALHIGPFGYRVFTDSAPVLEAELAVRSGQGWRGKHTLVLSREAGSMFFLGEIYVNLALPASDAVREHCGSCEACMSICPTQAIVAPYRLDARRCISYLTIEHEGPIPLELRPLLGNRIYGCDDCQLVCPWNKYARRCNLSDFDPRAGLDGASLITLFAWSEAEFLRLTEGSAIRRIGHARWLRNIAVAMGNALRVRPDPALLAALKLRAEHPDQMVREHVLWALAQAD